MTSPTEIELKLEIAEEDADRLTAASPLAGVAAETELLEATYYDSACCRLRAAGLSLRVRREGGRWLQTAKRAGGDVGLFTRGEWERVLDDAQPVVDGTAGPVAAALDGKAVAPLFRTLVTRTVRRLERDGATVEVALDRGAVVTPGREAPLCEVELELKAGSPAVLFVLARELGEAVPLRLGALSKSERGYRLARGEPDRAVKAGPVAISSELSAAALFQAVARSCLAQFRANEALLAHADDPAMLHQARVGLRRLRSAFALFRPLLAGDAEAARLKDELRALAGVLGEARDLDVLGGGAAIEPDAAQRIAEARAAAYARVHRRLAAAETRRLMLDLAEWLAFGTWLTAPADPGARDRPAGEAGAKIIDRFAKRLKKRGKHLATLDDEARHEVRIEAKKLRYATEFFAGLWPARKARRAQGRFLDALETLQDHLGALNDAASAAPLLRRLDLPPPREDAGERAHHLAGAEKAFGALMEAKRFWR